MARLAHAFIGAILGIALTHWVMHLSGVGMGAAGLPLLIAPMGASAVLLFAVPASPLAQPWAIVGGNVISALCGIACMKWIGEPALAAGFGVASAIVAMSVMRCLHPPGGAVALIGAAGGHGIAAAGWSFAVMPVGLNCLALVAIGWTYNAVTRGNYPHRAANHPPSQLDNTGYTMADLEQVLAQYDELLDVSSEDLDRLFRQVEARAYQRLHGAICCGQIMQHCVATIAPGALLADGVPLFAAHGLRALPVVDGDGFVEGLLCIEHLALAGDVPVARVMDQTPCITSPDTPIDALLPILSDGAHREALVRDAKGHLLGMITQTDLLAALWRGHIAEEITRHR